MYFECLYFPGITPFRNPTLNLSKEPGCILYLIITGNIF